MEGARRLQLVDRAADHRLTAREVQVQERCPESSRVHDGPGDGAGNVVKFQIQEDFHSQVDKIPDNGWARRRVEFQAHFEEAHVIAQDPDEVEGALPGGGVQSHDESAVALHSETIVTERIPPRKRGREKC